MARLIQSYNVLNLPSLDYEECNSNDSTIALVRKARQLFDAKMTIPAIAKMIDRSPGRTKELITGVNKIANSSVYKIIAGV